MITNIAMQINLSNKIESVINLASDIQHITY